MPWTVKDARQKNSKIRSDDEARMWVKVANKTLKAQLEKGASRDEAEAIAIKSASAALRNMHRKGSGIKASQEIPYLLLIQDTAPFLSLGERSKSGVSIHRYRKEVIKVGEYVKDSEGLRFSVTADTLQHWSSTARRMRRNGVKITVPLDHKEGAENNRGEIEDLFVDGDALVGVFALKGDDAPALAERNDVSIYVPPDFVDGKGNKYVRPIRHVALTPDPVVPGLGPWKRLAASLTLEKEADDMPIDLKKLQAGLGIKDELKEDNVVDLVLSRAGELTKEIGELKAKLEKPKDEPVKVSPELVSLSQESRELKLARLVSGDYPSKGDAPRLTPHAAEQLGKLFISKDHLTLALSHGRANDHDHFDELLAILAENDPVELGEKSGPQTLLRLSRGDKDGESLLVKDAERRAKEAG